MFERKLHRPMDERLADRVMRVREGSGTVNRRDEWKNGFRGEIKKSDNILYQIHYHFYGAIHSGCSRCGVRALSVYCGASIIAWREYARGEYGW